MHLKKQWCKKLMIFLQLLLYFLLIFIFNFIIRDMKRTQNTVYPFYAV